VLFRSLVAFRSPADPGSYSLEAARATVQRAEHSHARCYVVDHLDFLAEDPGSLTDLNVVSDT